MFRIDEWSRARMPHAEDVDNRWYGDRAGLRLSGLMGLGTELFVLMLFSVMNRLDVYLGVNLIGLNLLWGASLVYRRWVLLPKITKG